MTNLIRFAPSTDMRRLQREIDRMFEEFFPRSGGENADAEQAVWAPRVDLAETSDAYLVNVDVPGIPKDDITVNSQDGQLAISGDRKADETIEEANLVRCERTVGHFYRSFALPRRVDAEKISAAYDNGVLRIRVPKTEDSKPRQIKVN
jgi:HSP20 family protein